MSARKIKPGEQVAIEYFQSKGYSDIIHEPDGNVPPDLVIDGFIAIEVRRLNQFKRMNGLNLPLEDLEYSLMPRVRKLMESVTCEYSHTTYVSIDYKRPLKVDKILMDDIEKLLHLHIKSLDLKMHYQVRNNLRVRFWPTKKNYGRPYVWASSSDGDGGGFVVANILESLNIIIKEKQRKILPYKSKYDVWWLAVNDKIGFGIDDIDLDQLNSAFNIKTFFERIIFISPFDSLKGMELIVPPHAKI
jgi:hypothetical protein